MFLMRTAALHFVSIDTIAAAALFLGVLLVSGGAADDHANITLYTADEPLGDAGPGFAAVALLALVTASRYQE